MTEIPFSKFHGFGNDYIVIDSSDIGEVADVGALAIKMCDRHLGVGSDGIALIEKIEKAESHWSCRIINPDGSEGSFSGNGTRCAAAHLVYFNHFRGEVLRLATLSGIKGYSLIERDGPTFWFLAEIGRPHFAPEKIPFKSSKETVFEEELSIAGKEFKVTALNVGNPAAVIFVDDFQFDWRTVGRALETHEAFPERTNAVFAKVVDRENIEIRIWERGASETSSSGTCSIAAAVASAVTDRSDRKVSVHAVGGTTECVWREDDEMTITGRADFICRGSYQLP